MTAGRTRLGLGCLLAALAAGFGAPQAQAAAGFLLLGGLNLSSPRTASQISYSSYLGGAGGFGFDFHLAGAAFTEVDLLFVNRRYAAGFSMPTIMIPWMINFEKSVFCIGFGPYTGFILAASSDNGTPATPDVLAMPSYDVGVVASGGLKLPFTPRFTGIMEGRISHAFTGTSSFYWNQMQGFVGVQINLAAGRRFSYSYH